MLVHERLLEWIEYSPDTGVAIWKKRYQRAVKGQRVGAIMRGTRARNKPYRTFSCGLLGMSGRVPFSHLVQFYMTGHWPVDEMDHINGDSLDDRWENLREATRYQNEANKAASRDSKTGIKGVFPYKDGRFVSQIYRQGKHLFLGVFDDPQEARAAYLQAAKSYDGEFLRTA